MNRINLIQTSYKGFSCYLPKTKISLILKNISAHLFYEKDIIKHFFIYFDDRLGRGFRIFIQTEKSSELLHNNLLKFLKRYTSEHKNIDLQNQLFKIYPPFSIVPMKFIDENDEIYILKNEVQSSKNLLENLSWLITQKTEEFDFGDDDQKLEFTLELLIAGVAFNQFSNLSIQREFKRSLKSIPDYKKYLENKYSRTVEDSKDTITAFKNSLLLSENSNNLLTLFWKKNQVKDSKKSFEIIFKVLNINNQQKCYSLFILQNTLK